MLVGTGVLTALVLALVAWGFRPPSARPRGTRFWALGWGVAMPLAVLVVLVGTGLWMGEHMQARAGPEVVQVKAHARQWVWQFEQPGPDGSPVRTENVLFIPAGQPVHVHLTSADVIHSFWVPRFGGKMDAIPGHHNLLRIQANTPGRYSGLSAEFSGVGYGDMRFEVVVYPSNDIPPMPAVPAPPAGSTPAPPASTTTNDSPSTEAAP